MSDDGPSARITINDLFPEGSRVLLTGGGKDFIERIGVEVARRVVLSVMLGLTGKSIQNVLRSDRARMEEYAAEFQSNITQAAEKCRQDIGDLKMSLGFAEDPQGRRIELGWEDIARLTTAIGSQTLTIRG